MSFGSFLESAKRLLFGPASTATYVYLRVRPGSTQHDLQVLANYASFQNQMRSQADRTAIGQLLKQRFGEDTVQRRRAADMMLVLFLRHFGIVGMCVDKANLPELSRLKFVESVFVVPDENGLDYMTLMHGLHYLADQNSLSITCVNMSMAPPAPFDFDANEPVNVATRVLTERGMAVVVAAGNEGRSGPGHLSRWARAPWVISVGAADEFENRLWEDSSTALPGMPGPTVVARGENVVGFRLPDGVADPSAGWTEVRSGTSFAAPQVSGIVAMIGEFIAALARSEAGHAVIEGAGLNRPSSVVSFSPRVAKAMVERMAVPLAGYGLHEQGAGLVNREIARTYFERFDNREFTAIFSPS